MAEYGALLANDLLKETDMSLEDRITVIAAIGNHDESTGSLRMWFQRHLLLQIKQM